MIRCNGTWYVLQEKVALPVMWSVAKGVDPNKASREWYAHQRKLTSLLYPKDGN